MSSADVLQTYFAETMSGDMTAVDRHFVASPDYVLIAEDNPASKELLPWTGRQTDRQGIKRAYAMLLDALEVTNVTPGATVIDGEHVPIHGTFRYRARATNKTVNSAWAVHAVVRGDRIAEYRFYEDSYAVAAALRPSTPNSAA